MALYVGISDYKAKLNCVAFLENHSLSFVASCLTLLLNLNLPLAGAVARVVRACGRLRAVRRQRGGGDRHVAPPGVSSRGFSSRGVGCFLLIRGVLEVTLCLRSRWRRAC